MNTNQELSLKFTQEYNNIQDRINNIESIIPNGITFRNIRKHYPKYFDELLMLRRYLAVYEELMHRNYRNPL